MSTHITAVVAPLEPVAVRNICMIGYFVGVVRADFMSPMPNSMAMVKAIVRTPLITSATTILRGTTVAAFFTSSPNPGLSVHGRERNHQRNTSLI